MSVRIQARRGTEAQWVSADPVLAEGELAYSTDTEQLKIGEGTSNWSDLTYIGGLPEQSGFEGLFITTDGTNLSFADPLPDQTGQENKFLTTNGASASWGEVDLTPYATSASPTFTETSTFNGPVVLNNSINFTSASVIGLDLLPSQTGQSGKYLTTNGTSASWGTVDLSTKADINSPTFTGVPAAPTAAADTNTTQVATTAFVVGQVGTANPLMNGTVAVGTSLRYARQDHVHASDTSRAALSGATFTGVVTGVSPTAAGSIGFRRQTMSTAAPSGGLDGDVWLRY